MVLLKLIFLYLPVTLNPPNWTYWCRISSPLVVRQYSRYGSFHVQPWFGFFFYTLPPHLVLSHKLDVHHTWYMKKTQTHMFSCLLTLLRRTSSPEKQTPLSQADGRRTEALRSRSYLLCTSLWNILDENQATEIMFRPQFLEYVDKTPALTSWKRIMLLPISLCKKSKFCIDNIPVFCSLFLLFFSIEDTMFPCDCPFLMNCVRRAHCPPPPCRPGCRMQNTRAEPT